jgi:hypothetical protein
MNERLNDAAKPKADESQVEQDIEEFERLSGQGNSLGWNFSREEIHQRK